MWPMLIDPGSFLSKIHLFANFSELLPSEALKIWRRAYQHPLLRHFQIKAEQERTLLDSIRIQCFQLSDIIISVWACRKESSHQTL